jgi:hypothetical protein
MAEYGLEIYNENGDIIIDSENMSFTLIHAERVTYTAATLSSNFYTNPGRCAYSSKLTSVIANNPECIVATKCVGSWITNNNMTSSTVAKTAEVYVFAPSITKIAASDYGLIVNDVNGLVVFDSRAAPLRILKAVQLPPTQATWEYQADSSLSVAIAMNDLSEHRLNSGNMWNPPHYNFSRRQIFLSNTNKVTMSVRPYSVTSQSPPQPNPLYVGFNMIPCIMVIDVTGLSSYIGKF